MEEGKVPKGIPKDWTLDELNLVWTFDGGDGNTVSDLAESLGIAHGTWYSIKARLRQEGGPQALFERMQADKLRRYNAGRDTKSHRGRLRNETLAEALARVYTIRVSEAGRGGRYLQYTCTIPPTLAEPFTDVHGTNILFEAVEGGILIRPTPKVEAKNLPEWLTSTTSDPVASEEVPS